MTGQARDVSVADVLERWAAGGLSTTTAIRFGRFDGFGEMLEAALNSRVPLRTDLLPHGEAQVARFVAEVYRRLRAQPDRPDGTPAANGMGEATLTWVVANIESFHARDTLCLVLTEDGRAGDQMPEGVHVLSTRSWLTGLERLKVITSAREVIDAVSLSGRTPSRYPRDQRARDARGNTSQWTEAVVLPDEPKPGWEDAWIARA